MTKTPELERYAPILLALSRAGHRVFRNSVGEGRLVRPDGSIGYVRFGLCEGSSDLIGGTRDGRWLALEAKTEEGRSTRKQRDFLRMVRALGGRAGFVRTPEEALRIASGEWIPEIVEPRGRGRRCGSSSGSDPRPSCGAPSSTPPPAAPRRRASRRDGRTPDAAGSNTRS